MRLTTTPTVLFFLLSVCSGVEKTVARRAFSLSTPSKVIPKALKFSNDDDDNISFKSGYVNSYADGTNGSTGTTSTTSLLDGQREISDYFALSSDSPSSKEANHDDERLTTYANVLDDFELKHEKRSEYLFFDDTDDYYGDDGGATKMNYQGPGRLSATARVSSSSPSCIPTVFRRAKAVLHRSIKGCYMGCPGKAYEHSVGINTSHISQYQTHSKSTEMGIPSLSSSAHQHVTLLASVRSRLMPPLKRSESESSITVTPTTSFDNEEEEELKEPSPAVLSAIAQPLIPKSIWTSLTGREFFYPSTIQRLIRSGIRTAMTKPSEEFIDWTPADSKTKAVLKEQQQETDNDDDIGGDVIRRALNQGQVLVWTGKFKKEGHGSDLPLVKTLSIVPMSPKDMAELLMDSDRVKTYNKMSLGRKDEVVFQRGIDSSDDDDNGGFLLDGGEAKIVRNLTKPPLSKKLMEFVTLMCARRLQSNDDVGTGIMGGSSSLSSSDSVGSPSYIVMSRAVSGGKWNGTHGGTSKTAASLDTRGGNDVKSDNGGGKDKKKKKNTDGDNTEMIRSEILLGVNLLRSIPNEPQKTEITAVTHVNSPSVPKMLAGKVGVKGAIDFVRDIRDLCK